MPYIFRIQMNFYDRFLIKNLSDVTCILHNSGHESILDHLEETDDGFILNKPLNDVSVLPTYKFALSCTLASLGNKSLASQIIPNPENFVEDGYGDNISRCLVSDFLS